MNKTGWGGGVEALEPFKGDLVMEGENLFIALLEGNGSKATEEDWGPNAVVDPDGGCGVPSVSPGQATGEGGTHGSVVGRDSGEDVGHGGAGGGAEDADVFGLFNILDGLAIEC